jgi:hypothetical protein
LGKDRAFTFHLSMQIFQAHKDKFGSWDIKPLQGKWGAIKGYFHQKNEEKIMHAQTSQEYSLDTKGQIEENKD